MSNAAVPARSPQSAAGRQFDTAQLALADTRVAWLVCNHVRKLALQRVFGVSGAQANLLTFVLALGLADGAFETSRRLVGAPLGISGTDGVIGGFLLREGALGVAGPASKQMPFAGALLTAAVLGGLALPGLRRTTHRMRIAERRIREARLVRYAAARGGVASPASRGRNGGDPGRRQTPTTPAMRAPRPARASPVRSPPAGALRGR
jgi:hypothetical protein